MNFVFATYFDFERGGVVTGFQIFLCVLGGIIAFFVLVLSVPVHVTFSYGEKISLTIRYLFIKLHLLPVGEKKPKKEKKPKEEKPKEENKEEKPKEKKPNPILEMVKANGYDGMMEVLSNFGHILALYGGKLFKSVVFDEIEIYITVGTGDSAKTAIEYGKTCQKIYPLLGFICSNNLVKKYDASVEPDFLANHSEGEFYFDFHLIVRKVINSTVGMAFRMLFKVLLKFLMNAKKGKKPPENDAQKVNNENVQTKKG